jgi:lipoyl(octanoyl) transferase
LLLSNYKSFKAIPPAHESQLPELIVRRLGLQEYQPLFKSMRYLAEHIEPNRADEIWLLSHKPVYTQGQAGAAEHILEPGNIPVVQIDRGGQVTYHGPGQLVCYLLLNMRRRKFGVRKLVDVIESTVLRTLSELGIEASTKPKAPGIYVKDAKIAALGLRIKNGLSYHGLSLNVEMDLKPFAQINPCGFENLEVVQIADFVEKRENLLRDVSNSLSNNLLVELGYMIHY